MEERVGFEPTELLNSLNGFQDRLIKPLWHLSIVPIRFELMTFPLSAECSTPELRDFIRKTEYSKFIPYRNTLFSKQVPEPSGFIFHKCQLQDLNLYAYNDTSV